MTTVRAACCSDAWRCSRMILCSRAGPAPASFVTFESGQVRPLALSPDGARLFAVNTPDDRLEIFDVSAGRPDAIADRCRSAWSRWRSRRARRRGLGREPPLGQRQHRRRRLVARRASSARCSSATSRATSSSPDRAARAFITTAHRGQNRPDDPQLTTPGVGRARRLGVRRRRPRHRRSAARRSRIVTLFGDTPRALAVSPTAARVYAAVFHSGNQTTGDHEGAVCNGGAAPPPCSVGGATIPGGLPAPNVNFQGVPRPGGRAHRQVQPARATGRTSSAATGTARCASRCPTSTSSPSTRRRPARRTTGSVRRSRHDALQHGGQPGEREGLRLATPRRATRCASRAPASSRGSSVRGHLHEARITVLDGAERACRAT